MMDNALKSLKKALVLGGGGTTGIAWEIGILLGLAEGGIDVTSVDRLIGTSAGSAVGGQLISGLSLSDLYALQLRPLEETKEQVINLDPEIFMRVFGAGFGAVDAQTARAQIGALALETQTMSEAERLETIAARLPVPEWSTTREFLVNTVDARTGEWVVFDKDAGVSLIDAVAASCAVPGIYPPVSIGEKRYVDGGVRSGTNADLARGYDQVLIIRPDTLEWPEAIPHLSFSEELEELKATLSRVFVIEPDEASIAARGPNALDASRRDISAQAGRAQGQALARELRAFWR